MGYRLTEKGEKAERGLSREFAYTPSSRRRGYLQKELLRRVRQTGSGLEAVNWELSWFEGPEYERGDYLSRVMEEFDWLVEKGFIEEV